MRRVVGSSLLKTFTLKVAAQCSCSDDLYNKPWLQQESFGLLDASLTFNTANEKIRVSVYGKNLTDEEYFDYAADVGTLDSARWGGTPRTYGVRVAYKY